MEAIIKLLDSPGNVAEPAGDRPRRTPESKRRAFTLVELLVVIGIITVLIAILLPALSAARQQAQTVQCMSNMRQLGIGLTAYVTDNEQVLPVQATDYISDFGESGAPPNFLLSLLPYLSNVRTVLTCPTAPDIGDNPAWIPTASSNTNYMGNAAVLGHPISRVSRASEVVYLQEHWRRERIAWLRPRLDHSAGGVDYFSVWHDSQYYGFEVYETLHSTGTAGNVVFIDGHAETRAYRSMHSSDFGLTPDDPWMLSNSYTGLYTTSW